MAVIIHLGTVHTQISIKHWSMWHCPMETGAVIFLKEPSLVIVLPCSSCTQISRVKVDFPSQFSTFSVVTKVKPQDDTWCVPTTSCLSSRRMLTSINWDTGLYRWKRQLTLSLSHWTSFSTAETQARRVEERFSLSSLSILVGVSFLTTAWSKRKKRKKKEWNRPKYSGRNILSKTIFLTLHCLIEKSRNFLSPSFTEDCEVFRHFLVKQQLL